MPYRIFRPYIILIKFKLNICLYSETSQAWVGLKKLHKSSRIT